MYQLGLLDNLRTRPGVSINKPLPVLPIERKPLPTLPPIVGDRRYIPTITCKAMTPACMGQEKWEQMFGSKFPRKDNPGRRFLHDHLQERRRMAVEAPPSNISEPNGNNPSTM